MRPSRSTSHRSTPADSFEEMGSVRPDGSDIRHFPDLGFGLNEIAEGPDGRLYVTRYAPGGSIVVLTPEGDEQRGQG